MLFLLRAAGTLLALTAILQLLDLLDQASQIVTHGGIGAIGHYVTLRFPSLLAGAVPLGVLAGALLCFLRLAGNGEMTALRATGASLSRIMLTLLPACAAVAVVQFALQAEIAPRSARALSNWWQRTLPHAAPTVDQGSTGDRVWLHLGSDIISVRTVSSNGRVLGGVTIVHRAPSGDLLDRIDAHEARYDAHRWTLRDGTVIRPDGSDAQPFAQRDWPDAPSPANLIDVARPVGSLPVERLLGILHGRWASAHGRLTASTSLDSLLVALLDPLLMMLLAAPLLLTPPRAGIDGLRTLRVVGLGLGYLGLSGLLAAMGDSGALPPILATTVPVLAFGGWALFGVLQADAG